MRQILVLFICSIAGVAIGWYLGYTRPSMGNQRELLKRYQYFEDHIQDFNAGTTRFNELVAKYSKEAKPYEADTASIALAALKALDTNDVEATKSRLAAIIAIYYNKHSHDGEANLLGDITNFAGTDNVLSNAINPASW